MQVGDQFFLPLNIRYENRWRDAWVLFAFSGMYLALIEESCLLIVMMFSFQPDCYYQ